MHMTMTFLLLLYNCVHFQWSISNSFFIVFIAATQTKLCVVSGRVVCLDYSSSANFFR